MAAFTASSFLVAEGGRLMSCGFEDEGTQGMLGHDLLDGEDPVIATPTLLPSVEGIRISSVASGFGFRAAVSAAGTVYTWGIGVYGCLGHGDTEHSLVPEQVQALAGH